MWKMLQTDSPDDFVIATGETHTVREFVDEAAEYFGLELEWVGVGREEKGLDKKTGNVIVEIDQNYFRPNEVEFLQGDASKARRLLGWCPTVTFKELVKFMAEEDLKYAEEEVKLGRPVVVQRKYLVK